ncbi:MAG: hypothetical protein K9N55_05695 [Phycisphaerae bacterium]|nr:hypothetical protein [Phycisphaerae bacterium]
MWNVFEQPWLLTAIAFGLFLLIGTFRSAYPEKVKAWTWGVPALILAAGFGLDYGVQTDHEKVLTTLKQLVQCAQIQDAQGIDRLTAPDYSDSYHRSKTRLLTHIESRFSRPVFEKIKVLSLYVETLDNGTATAALNTTVIFHPESTVAQVVGRSLIARVTFIVSRQTNGQWLLRNMELVEVNRQPVNWRQASGQF